MAIDGVSSSSSFTNVTRYWGLASGLDVDEIVRGFMLAERAPLDRLLQRKQILEWQQEDLRSINLKLRELDDLAFQLRLDSTFNARRVAVSDPGAVEARVSAGAAVGTHTLKVEQLAEGVQLHSGVAFEDGKTFQQLFGELPDEIEFTITNVTSGQSETIRIDTQEMTIRDLAAQINNAGLGLWATYEPDLGYFFLSSTDTGTDVQFRFEEDGFAVGGDTKRFLADYLQLSATGGTSVSGGSLDSGDVTFQGRDAKFTYNGVTVTRSTNTFTAGGVNFTLLQADPNKTVTVTVSQDTDAIIETIDQFVTKYNEIVTLLNAKLEEKRYYDYPPLTEAQRKEMTEEEIKLWEERAKSGLLRGDSMLSRILSEMRLALTSPVSGTDSRFSSLADIGIRTGGWQERGILHLDKDALGRALEEDAAGVAALFRNDGSNDAAKGVVRRLEQVLDLGMEHITNRVGRAGAPVDDSAIGRQIGWLNDAIERAEARLAQREAYYYRQFSVLESYLSMMNSQSMWLYQAFGGGM